MDKNKLIFRYLFADVMASLIVWVLFVAFRIIVNDVQIFEGVQFLIPNYNYLVSLVCFPFYCLFIHYICGYYLNPIKKSQVTEVFSTFVSTGIISLSIFLVRMFRDVAVSLEYFYFSLIVLFILLFIFTITFRTYISSQVRRNYKQKKWTVNTIIIGTGSNALRIASEFEKYAHQNTLIGFISIDKRVMVEPQQILGAMNQLSAIIEKNNIEEAVVALDNADEYQLFSIINSLYKFNIDIRFTPRLYEILTGSARINRLEISPLVSITDSSMADWQASVKRFSDIVISLVTLVVLSPFLCYFIIRIKRDSEGPAFYKQERIGRYGKPFEILKFRTMYLGAEGRVPSLSSADDDRITAIGRTLRKFRIDEIPQFWNILKGDMSLVGPRPERRYYINQIIEEAPYYCLLYKIRPGLTSWGPIKIGYSDTVDKMIERLNYDIIYLDNMSLFTDIKILIYTLEIIFKGKGI
jgi:exopolysaccharide biosynthesis polyprenyl glycosylphosphotransferase